MEGINLVGFLVSLIDLKNVKKLLNVGGLLLRPFTGADPENLSGGGGPTLSKKNPITHTHTQKLMITSFVDRFMFDVKLWKCINMENN